MELQLEEYRRPLTGYCYRMLGSSFDAEDAVQETMLRAWRSIDRFEGRSSLKSWLFSIATNVCLDQLDGAKRRARPMELTEVGSPQSTLNTLPEVTWIEPIPDDRVLDESDPAALAEAKETLRLAFIAALQHLPPKQRAVLILREVLRWKAEEVATLLDTSVASVNSALQRARASIDQMAPKSTDAADPMDAEQKSLLDSYMSAFTAYDIDKLVTLLHEDATLSMPPYDLWMVGRAHIHEWHLGMGIGCKGSLLIPTVANGMPAFGQYRSSGPNGEFEPWALQVMEISGDKIVGLNSFLDVGRLFPMFGLPQVPEQHLL
jgi:RNA polymerase sigma-70 factor (ECF subfamily)